MPRARSTRRAAWALATLLLAASLAACARTERTIHVRDGHALGTVIEVKVVTADPVAAKEALDAVFAELNRVEAFASPHVATSELSRMNARTSPTFEVTREMDALLRAARRVSEESDGAFDVTIGGVVRLWGFPESPALPDSSAIAAVRAHVAWRGLEPVETTDAVGTTGSASWRCADPATQIDLGGVAAGWAVDRAADAAMTRVDACLLNAGGDVAIRGTRPDGTPWILGVQHPRDPSKLLRRLRIPSGRAVATSGDYEHFFEANGVRYHHIFDPRTGFPANTLVSTTVIAKNCVLADTWSTASFVLGPVEGLRRLEEHPDLEGILVAERPDGTLAILETSGIAALVVE